MVPVLGIISLDWGGGVYTSYLGTWTFRAQVQTGGTEPGPEPFESRLGCGAWRYL